MALSLSYTVELSCDGTDITFTETSGAYNADTNTGGWGAPNYETTDCVSKQLVITAPDGTEYTILNADSRLNVLPATDDSGVVVLNGADLGGVDGDVIADGTYIFDYECTMNDDAVVSKRVYVYFDSVATCCVSTMFGNLDVSDCCCDNDAVDAALQARTFLLAARYAALCGRSSKATKLIALVNKLCSDTGNCINC